MNASQKIRPPPIERMVSPLSTPSAASRRAPSGSGVSAASRSPEWPCFESRGSAPFDAHAIAWGQRARNLSRDMWCTLLGAKSTSGGTVPLDAREGVVSEPRGAVDEEPAGRKLHEVDVPALAVRIERACNAVTSSSRSLV